MRSTRERALEAAGMCDAVDRHRKALTGALALAAFSAVLVAGSAWPRHEPAHETIEAFGFLLLAASAAGRMFCTLYIGGRKNRELVGAGPYSVVRNPLYACSVLGVAAIGLCVGSLVLGAAFGAAAFALFSAVVRAEERRLLRRFGEAYRRYLDEVPRWIPQPRLWRDPERWEMTPRLVSRAAREGLGLLLLAALIKSEEVARAGGLLPLMMALP